MGQRVLGFFADDVARVWEYPVTVRFVLDHLALGSRVLDVGAGITPVAPFLTSRGYVVETVDPSTIRRVWPPAADWDELGFLDYAEAGLAHRSWNCPLGEIAQTPDFDGVLSINDMEKVPETGRRALLRDIATRLRVGGMMILAVELERGGMTLRNQNRGERVDESARRGTLDDVLAEGSSVGFELVHSEVVREWGDAEVDIGLIVMRRKEVSETSSRRSWGALRRFGRSMTSGRGLRE